jgi:two-component system CheB/CheR fusion protein
LNLKGIIHIKDFGMGCLRMFKINFYTSNEYFVKARKDNKGAGIGLLLVKGFVEKMMVKYESKEGIGSTFLYASAR